MGIYVKFWHFYNVRSPNIAMSRDPRSKFRKIYFFLILHLILGKVTKFLVEKLSTSEVISQKPHRGWKSPPLGLRGGKQAFTLFTCFLLDNKFHDKHDSPAHFP